MFFGFRLTIHPSINYGSFLVKWEMHIHSSVSDNWSFSLVSKVLVRSDSFTNSFFSSDLTCNRHRFARLILVVKRVYEALTYRVPNYILFFLFNAGHEFPFAIKMNHMREAAMADDDGFHFPLDYEQQLPTMDPLSPETQCQFILKRNEKMTNRIPIGKATSSKMKQGVICKTANRRRPPV